MLNKIKFGTVAMLAAALLAAACASTKPAAEGQSADVQLRGRLPLEATMATKGPER